MSTTVIRGLKMVGPYVIGLVLPLVVGFIVRRATTAAQPPVQGEGEGAMGTWSLDDGNEVLPDGAEEFLDKLAEELGFDIVVTSGTRTAEEQASAMWAKKERYDAALEKWQAAKLAGVSGEELKKMFPPDSDDLRKLYRSSLTTIEELLPNPRAAWGQIIQAHMARGEYLSRHLTGRALDVRTRDLTQAQVKAIEKSVKAAGGKSLVESDHLHLDLPAPTIS